MSDGGNQIPRRSDNEATPALFAFLRLRLVRRRLKRIYSKPSSEWNVQPMEDPPSRLAEIPMGSRIALAWRAAARRDWSTAWSWLVYGRPF